MRPILHPSLPHLYCRDCRLTCGCWWTQSTLTSSPPSTTRLRSCRCEGPAHVTEGGGGGCAARSLPGGRAAVRRVRKRGGLLSRWNRLSRPTSLPLLPLLPQRTYNREAPRIYNTVQCYLKDSNARLLTELERARREVGAGRRVCVCVCACAAAVGLVGTVQGERRRAGLGEARCACWRPALHASAAVLAAARLLNQLNSPDDFFLPLS